MLNAGVSHPIVAEIMGWSASTAIRMIRDVYGHVSLTARSQAIQQTEAYMEKLAAESAVGWPQNEPQFEGGEKPTIQ